MKYFNDVTTLEELRKQYRDLLKQYHPDNPQGSTEATQAINAEYDQLFKVLKNKHDTRQTDSTDHQESAYNANMYDWENDKALREVLQKIINFSGVDIEIIGQWVWVFNSYGYRKELKEMGFKFASSKKAWYFHTETFRKLSKKALSINDIRNYWIVNTFLDNFFKVSKSIFFRAQITKRRMNSMVIKPIYII